MSVRNHGSVLGFLVVGVLAGCAPAAKTRGQLMIAVATDMSIPKNMDQVVVEVLDEQGNKQSFDYPVKPTDLGKPMPGTLAIVPPNAGGQTVRVRLIAELDMSPAPPTVRVVREAVVKVPTDRTALLPMPLHWLCDGHYKENDDGTYQSDCADDTKTCVAGQCVDAVIATETLRDYKPQLVFGGGDDQGNGGHCIDIPTCFGASTAAVPDGDCTLPLADSVDMSSFNVALELAAGSDGECTMGAVSRCFLPLDSDPVEGWWIDGGRVHLPPAACDVIAHGKALGVATTGMCPTKDPSVPICGLWTNVSTSSLAGDGSKGDIMSSHDGGGVSSNGPDASTRPGTGAGTAAQCHELWDLPFDRSVRRRRVHQRRVRSTVQERHGLRLGHGVRSSQRRRRLCARAVWQLPGRHWLQYPGRPVPKHLQNRGRMLGRPNLRK